MVLTTADFAAFHAAIHGGTQPFPWQQRLLDQIVRDKCWPRALDLPTGVGKTTCIDIALFALALDSSEEPERRWCPRRIVMVVDRRTVVDQAAERGRVLLRALTESTDPVAKEVAERLRKLTKGKEEPLGVYTLRGGIPKDDGWARTPDQPLIIASTVDHVGSRLLMQGYGVSPSMKPVHGGLLANDVLLLLDEVHLSEPFRQTLDQLALLRERFSNGGLPKRFFHVFLSATPGSTNGPTFSLLEDEKEPESPLGPRLHAAKPVRLIEVDGRAELEKACVEHAKELLTNHRTIAVVVNRVGSASEIARHLTESLGEKAIVTLLTGRMRPLDRDDVLREILPAVEAGRKRSDVLPKRAVVATQCIEAGADFDFDALVTEAASLDALQQRFGRVDRLGEYGKAEGVIIYETSERDDPIYAGSIGKTFSWLKDHEKKRRTGLKEELKKLRAQAKNLEGEEKREIEELISRKELVDFGILALEVSGADEMKKLLAPKPSAPTLLPGYMDLWVQTSPPPCQLPDVSLWLHGPSAGPPDGQVVWRADLSEAVLGRGDTELATSIVASVRPSSLEAMSLPFPVARAWLWGTSAADGGDTEGVRWANDTSAQTGGRSTLRWKGDASEIITASSLRPGDTIVVPASYGGIRNGCFDPTCTDLVADRAEQANLFARARPALRLHPEVIKGLGLSLPLETLQEPDEVRKMLGQLADTPDWPEWKKLWARKLSEGSDLFVVQGESGSTVLQGKRVPLAALRQLVRPEEALEDGAELTTNEDDSFYAGRSTSLDEHSRAVETFAREYALGCGLSKWLVEHMALAAWLHDIGKADRRFQIMLRGGSAIEYYKNETPLAKSAIPPNARELRRLAQRQSGYPRGARHELQSLAMLRGRENELAQRLKKFDSTREPDLELVLYLVSSHHGYCRPFAPVVIDDAPEQVSLAEHKSETFVEMTFGPTTSQHNLHRLDSPLADRFWRLVAKYGWQDLCWMEAMLRLADHRASEDEQTKEA